MYQFHGGGGGVDLGIFVHADVLPEEESRLLVTFRGSRFAIRDIRLPVSDEILLLLLKDDFPERREAEDEAEFPT